MSFSDEQRNSLRRLVDDCRDDLAADLAEVLGSLGIDRDGAVKPESALSADHPEHAARLETRRLLLRLMGLKDAGAPASKANAERVEGLLRGLAFTHLHRFVAFKMMEAPERKIFREIVGPKRAMGEIPLWLASDAPAGLLEEWDVGHPEVQDRIYLQFLQALCAKLHPELGALFDPEDLASRVFPKRWKDLLGKLNQEAFAEFWNADETLGWVYQYYTPKSLRDEARKASPSVPRNAWELAFRNQFYTPDYVVRFLADNTLGRLWVEMHPESALRGVCRKLLLGPGEELPARAPKDPREIRVLDPACGSGHFLLYCFGLFEHVYKDAWEHPVLGPALQRDFDRDRERFYALIPKLIVENNLHGIDIDRRAVQIASLALWLRARKGLPEKARKNPPLIERSGVVCAEPLGGSDSDYIDFRQALAVREPTAARLLDRAREMLGLAGDLGSLLRVDLELPRLVKEEREKQLEQLRAGGQQLALLAEVKKEEARWLDFSDARRDEGFWQEQEGKLRENLLAFGELAEGVEGAARRLFAKDGAAVLRFLDAVRGTYDVVLMNPPFGAGTARGKKYVEERYPNSRQDLAMCFVERAMGWVPDGFVGVLSTDAGFFRKTLEPWRREVLLAQGSMEAMAHLGDNVLDTAKVRVAAYTIRRPKSEQRAARYLRVLGKKERLARFDGAIAAVQEGQAHDAVTQVEQGSFAQLPYAVFGYWCSEGVRAVFAGMRAVHEQNVAVRQGTATAADPRFLRLSWELVRAGDDGWLPFAKGGDYSPFHDDVHLLLNWAEGGAELSAFPKSVIRNPEWYGLPGLTYPRRTNKRFAPRVMPSGCAFADKGPGIFTRGTTGPADPIGTAVAASSGPSLFALLGLLNTRPFQYLLSLGTGMTESADQSNSYEVGLLKLMPLPDTALTDSSLATAARAAYDARRDADLFDETTSSFVLPFTRPEPFAALLAARIRRADEAAAHYAAAVATLETRALAHYDFDAAIAAEIEHHVGPLHQLETLTEKTLAPRLARDILSWALGVALGRFDPRLATGERPWPEPTDPFAPVPLRSPGMLPADAPPDSTLVDDDGILVDDPTHPDDIVRRVAAVLQRVWPDTAPEVIRDLARALKLKPDADPLRAWYTRIPNGAFWEDHRKRYAKSKREAPIYVPLRSPGGHWLAWVAYHRLTRQTLYALLGERYLLAWRRRLTDELAPLRERQRNDTKLTATERDRLDELTAREADLGAFENLLRAALHHRTTAPTGEAVTIEFDPQHHDGVLVCLAPLHALIPWPPKNKKSRARSRLEEIWHQLESGQLDWSRTAMRYFPARVRAACDTDLSLAIAHGLADQLPHWTGWRDQLAKRPAEATDETDAERDDDEAEDPEDEA